MKRNMTRKFTLALSSFMVAAVALTSATFAWFTLAGSAQVDQFQMTVSAAPGLKIGLKIVDRVFDYGSDGQLGGGDDDTLAIRYGAAVGEVVYFSAITNEILTDFFPFSAQLMPVTATSGQTFAANANPVLNQFEIGTEAPSVAVGGFYQVEMYLYSQQDSTVTLANTIFSTPVGENSTEQEEVLKALRLGVSNETYTKPDQVYVSEANAQWRIYSTLGTDANLFGRLDLDGDGYYDSEVAGTNDYSIPVAAQRELVYGLPGNLTYQEDVDGETVSTGSSAFTANRTAGTYYASSYGTGTVQDTNTSALTFHVPGIETPSLANGWGNRVTVTIWVEGWDLSSVNEIGLADFVTSLKFSSVSGITLG